jgi:hypothetical protein
MDTNNLKVTKYDPMFGFRIKKEFKDLLEKEAHMRSMTPSDLCRLALMNYIEIIDDKYYRLKEMQEPVTDKDCWQVISPDKATVFTGTYNKAWTLCRTLNKHLLL